MSDLLPMFGLGVLVALAIGLYLYTIIWAAMDAKARGASWLLAAILVAFLSWPLGLVIWLLFRPKPSARVPQRMIG
jgi:hypothetical protein